MKVKKLSISSAVSISVLFLQCFSAFLVSPAARKERLTCHSAMSSGGLSIRGIQMFFFTSKKFSHFHFFMHFCLFHAILSSQKKIPPPNFFSPKIFLGEARRDTMLPAFLALFSSRDFLDQFGANFLGVISGSSESEENLIHCGVKQPQSAYSCSGRGGSKEGATGRKRGGRK